MADFINTVDVLGDDVVTGSIINRTVTEYLDNYVTKIGKYAFCQCVNLSKVDCPNVSEISDYAFSSCTSLTSVSFPVATNIREYAFYGCSSLTSVSFPAATTIEYSAFAYCSSLTTVILAGSSVCYLRDTNALSYTPIASGTGYIYVPSSLVASYQAATNWSYFSAQISAI